MAKGLEFVVRSLLVGGGATVVMDLWLLLLRRGLGVPTLDYAMLGRWLGHIPRGTYVHVNIAKAEPLPVERVLGWFAHYAIGITFAAVLLAIWGLDWARSPTLLPALLIGLATVAAPFLVLQPALGAGIASSKAKNPTAVRLRSVLTHTVYGLGLYASARFWAAIVP